MNPLCRFTPRHNLHAALLWLICLMPLHASAQTPDATPDTPPEAQTDAVPATPPSFEQLVQQLAGGSLRDRAATVQQLSSQSDERLADIFNALVSGDLLANKDKPPVVAIRNGDQLTDALSGAELADSKGLRRIPVNNSLRTQLRGQVAQLNLNHPNTDKRYAAVQRFIRDGVDAETAALLQAHQQVEESGRVQDAISTALAVYQLQSPERDVRLAAIDELSGSLEQEARNALRGIAENDADAELRSAAAEAIESIQGRISFYRFVENLFFGLSLGSVLLLAAIGLAITFGVMGVINMAHGELIMIGAYTTWGVQVLFPDLIEWSLLIAIPAAFLITALVGIAIERGVIRFLYGRPLETLLATFGLSLVLQQAVRTLFSPLNRSVSSPEWISGTLSINPVLSITYTRLYILIFGLMVFFALMLVMKRTTLGLKVRAVSQNRAMARAVGVRSSWVDALTFGLGSGVAGVAGVALSQLTNVGPNLGQAYIIDSFMVVVFGGVGNLWGTLVSAMSLGLINNFLEPYAGAMLAKVLVLIMLILFIQKKPKGLFPQKGRAAAD
ncbi:urea transport system permease protein [Halopseudomonas sabulinigri]|uniref:Urea transport system permease protein n=1 Tax=Halopseudomonas sabulinigri TaxID=472181 RepID=A0A1H1RGA7_9GAMM|nr:urea ABC transporter permease subunit UrtB [Halopseudomonas sabulinigri]SDS34781.1 urea transport system permease protein [Halopseudomonas sabulinigri]